MGASYKGIFSANTTPFSKEGKLDTNGLSSEINHLIGEGINGFFAGGTYGEGAMMTADEYREYIEAFTGAAQKRVPVIAQVGAVSFAQAVEQAHHAQDAGVDALAAIPPYYFPHDDAAILGYFEDLARESSLPIFVYNNPWRSGNKISPVLMGKLAKIPAVQGMKDSGDSLQEFCKFQMQVGEDFHMMIGNDDMTLGAFLMGAPGGIIVLSGLFPKIYTGLYKAFLEGDFEKAKHLQNEAIKIRMVLKIGPYISTYKEVLNLLGRCGGYSRKPIRMPTDDEMNRIKSGLQNLGYL